MTSVNAVAQQSSRPNKTNSDRQTIAFFSGLVPLLAYDSPWMECIVVLECSHWFI